MNSSRSIVVSLAALGCLTLASCQSTPNQQQAQDDTEQQTAQAASTQNTASDKAWQSETGHRDIGNGAFGEPPP